MISRQARENISSSFISLYTANTATIIDAVFCVVHYYIFFSTFPLWYSRKCYFTEQIAVEKKLEMQVTR